MHARVTSLAGSPGDVDAGIGRRCAQATSERTHSEQKLQRRWVLPGSQE
jgi:hypothetical protein